MLSVIDELLIVYINVCSFHWILLDIRVDKGIVQVMDPLKRNLEEFHNMQDMLQRLFSRYISLFN